MALMPANAAADTLAAPSALPAVNNFLDRHRYIWQKAKENLLHAQSEQKSYADKHRRDELFAVGDEVLLSTKDLRLAADSTGVARADKLTSRFVGPLKIIRVINPNAYELELPPQLHIHPVQNISKLRRYLRSPARFTGRPQPLARPPPECVDPAGEEIYVVERILAQRRVGRRQEYLVKWFGYPTEESSWEPRGNLRCPDKLAEFEAQQRHAVRDADAIALAVLELIADSPLSEQTAVRSHRDG
jgi:hypothetical protein